MAYWMVVRSVYSCIVTLGVNVRICRDEGSPDYQARPSFRSASVVLAYRSDTHRRAWSTIRRQSRVADLDASWRRMHSDPDRT